MTTGRLAHQNITPGTTIALFNSIAFIASMMCRNLIAACLLAVLTARAQGVQQPLMHTNCWIDTCLL